MFYVQYVGPFYASSLPKVKLVAGVCRCRRPYYLIFEKRFLKNSEFMLIMETSSKNDDVKM